MKYMSNCPHKAIETAHGLIIATSIVLTLFSTLLINYILNSSPFINWGFLKNEEIKNIMITILFFPLLFIG
jgi:Na+/alanine symporter